MFKVNVSFRLDTTFIIVISTNLPEPKVFSNTNGQMKCVGYRCQGTVSLTQRFLVQRSRPWLLHSPQQLKSGHSGSILIKGIQSHRRRDGLMSLTC